MAREAREAKRQMQEAKEAEEARRQQAKASARAFRVQRSAAFKRNVSKYGLLKAKYIANIISKK